MAAKGILNTADMVASIETRAISLEPRALDSNSKKKANMTRTASRIATMPQFTRASKEGNSNGMTKEPMPVSNISARQI